MSKFIVRGKNTLRGTVTVGGSKNAALPVIFAALSLFGTSRIVGLPHIGDVDVALELIKEQGATVTREGDVTVISTENLTYKKPSRQLVSSLRASTYLIGACLARFGRVDVGGYGGCSFCARPVDYHIDLACAMGATFVGDTLTLSRPSPIKHKFPKPSVGATANFLILASSIEGESRLENAAREPHIDTLIAFLRSAGAKIEREGSTLTVTGGALHGGCVTIPGDPIEAATFISASLATGGSVRVLDAQASELSPLLDTLRRAGATVSCDLGITVTARQLSHMSVVAGAYPGFPTDMQPLCAPIFATHFGGHIFDTVWQGRYGYLSQLARLGVRYTISDKGAEIYPSDLTAGCADAVDLRGGAACIITALAADGYSVINSAETVLRGYSDLVRKLFLLGADIEYLKDG